MADEPQESAGDLGGAIAEVATELVKLRERVADLERRLRKLEAATFTIR